MKHPKKIKDLALQNAEKYGKICHLSTTDPGRGPKRPGEQVEGRCCYP